MQNTEHKVKEINNHKVLTQTSKFNDTKLKSFEKKT